MVDIYLNRSKSKEKKAEVELSDEESSKPQAQQEPEVIEEPASPLFEKDIKEGVNEDVKQNTSSQKKVPTKTKNTNNGKKDYIKDKDLAVSLQHGFLASFLYFPKNAHFSTQDPQENIVLMLRRHFITNIPWIIVSLLLFAAPFFVFRISAVNFIPERFQIVGFLMWYMLSMAYFYEKFLSWYFQVAIVTDERVIDVDFVNLIYREITAAKIEQIQDVTVQMGGVIRSIFNYGGVYIQTASEQAKIEYLDVPKPDTVASVLRELMTEEEQEKIEGRVR